MNSILAKVIACDCVDCRNDLIIGCRTNGLPRPESEIIFIPEDWAQRTCPHGKQGITMRFGLTPNEVADTEHMIGDDAYDIEAPDGWLNMSAHNGIGYSAREQGRYGSYPTHDRFDGDSEP